MPGQQNRIYIDSIIYDDEKMERRLKAIGKKITKERIKQHLSISKLAELSNLSTSCVSKVEVASCRISLRTLIKIAGALNVPVGTFLDSKEDIDYPRSMLTEVESSLTNGERFEQIMEDAGDGTVDFFLNMADNLIQVINKEKKTEICRQPKLPDQD